MNRMTNEEVLKIKSDFNLNENRIPTNTSSFGYDDI